MRTPARIIRTTAAAILAAMLVLTSCWKVEPDLELSTQEIDFGTGMEEATVTVTNDSKDNALTSGVTALDYAFKSDRSWVTVTPVGGRLDGERSSVHTIAIDRSALVFGANAATITVNSNGGNKTISVLATRTIDGCRSAPSAPSGPSPDNGAESVPLSAVLSWADGESQCDALTATYDVYFGTSAAPPFHHNNGSARSWDPSQLAENTLYYWRVVAKDANGSTTGPTWSFRTTGTLQCNLGPDQLTSLSPPDDATDVSLDQDIAWGGGESRCAGLTATYDVYFGTSSPPPFHHNNGTAKSWDPGTLQEDRSYYWRIVAKDTNGSTSSSERNFRTRECDDNFTAPCNPSPKDGKKDVNTKSSTLSWQCGAVLDDDECEVDVMYVVYFGRTSDLTESHRVGSTTSQSYKVDELQSKTTYYWKVVARSGDTSKSSPIWDFTTR